MGTMFFVSPVAALRNVHMSLVPGGKLIMVVWRRREDNLWLYRAHDEATCDPGPFSMRSADTTSDVLLHAGFTDISLTRCDLEILGGRNIDEALDLVMSIGPAGEILRLQGEGAAHLLPQVETALREGLAEFERDDGTIWAPASTWLVTATAPETA
jgi:hypothetical protein